MERYKRLDDVVPINEISKWLEDNTNGWNIINYKEVPSHKPSYTRIQVILEKQKIKIVKKKPLNS